MSLATIIKNFILRQKKKKKQNKTKIKKRKLIILS